MSQYIHNFSLEGNLEKLITLTTSGIEDLFHFCLCYLRVSCLNLTICVEKKFPEEWDYNFQESKRSCIASTHFLSYTLVLVIPWAKPLSSKQVRETSGQSGRVMDNPIRPQQVSRTLLVHHKAFRCPNIKTRRAHAYIHMRQYPRKVLQIAKGHSKGANLQLHR